MGGREPRGGGGCWLSVDSIEKHAIRGSISFSL